MKKTGEQKEVVEAVKLVGRLTYDWENTKNGHLEPVWLRNLFGDSFFSEVVVVHHTKTELTDSELAYLHGLPKLQGLFLYKVTVSDADVERLKSLQQLKYLCLKTPATEDVVANLQRALPRCQIIVDH